ncbi:hypothetical protein VH441_00330 [Psychrobacter sp. HD31]|uniref:hypothetical protein n=1 Tax=Psychrobacter sp. HD31 TaxID=3112003 RepID=UPI003DA525F2
MSKETVKNLTELAWEPDSFLLTSWVLALLGMLWFTDFGLLPCLIASFFVMIPVNLALKLTCVMFAGLSMAKSALQKN